MFPYNGGIGDRQSGFAWRRANNCPDMEVLLGDLIIRQSNAKRVDAVAAAVFLESVSGHQSMRSKHGKQKK
jgi:hypothetical protein